MQRSIEISHRTDFSLLCNARGLMTAIEVGTDRGVFACDFLSKWHGNDLICVDPYFPYGEMSYTRDCDRMMAVLALQKYHPRARIMQCRSVDAVDLLQSWQKPRGFVYIDGAHDYISVKDDLWAWWGELSNNGILAGHDYDVTHPDVIRAVDEFAEIRGMHVYITHEVETPSWYMYKNEPPMLIQQFFATGETTNPHYEADE